MMANPLAEPAGTMAWGAHDTAWPTLQAWPHEALPRILPSGTAASSRSNTRALRPQTRARRGSTRLVCRGHGRALFARSHTRAHAHSTNHSRWHVLVQWTAGHYEETPPSEQGCRRGIPLHRAARAAAEPGRQPIRTSPIQAPPMLHETMTQKPQRCTARTMTSKRGSISWDGIVIC